MSMLVHEISYLKQLIEKFHLNISIYGTESCRAIQGQEKKYILFSEDHNDIVKENFKRRVISKF